MVYTFYYLPGISIHFLSPGQTSMFDVRHGSRCPDVRTTKSRVLDFTMTVSFLVIIYPALVHTIYSLLSPQYQYLLFASCNVILIVYTEQSALFWVRLEKLQAAQTQIM